MSKLSELQDKIDNKIEEMVTLPKELILKNENGVTKTSYLKKYRTLSEKFRKKICQSWNPKEINVTKAGVTYNCYDQIQQYEPDSNFYKVLENYNCTKDEAVERMQGRFQEIKTALNFGESYAEALMNVNKAKEEFDLLPANVKSRFNNSVAEFMENGEKWINETFKQAQQPIIENTMGDTINE